MCCHLGSTTNSREKILKKILKKKLKKIGFWLSKSPSCGKSTVFKLASWKFRHITLLFKNCISSKFQPPRACAAILAVQQLLEVKNYWKNFDFWVSKSSSCGKSTVFKLASWKFRHITPIFKNCISSKFQPPRACAAILAVQPILDEKNLKKKLVIDF